MTVDIFIRTYHQDIKWIFRCIKSIEKFGKGFRDIIVCIPNGQEVLLVNQPGIKLVTCPVYKNDYIGQQLSKLHAFEYTDAEYILFIDSDCIFTEKFDIRDYFMNDMPVIVKENYERLKEHKDAYLRKNVIERYMGEDIEFEYMRRHPFIYRRDSLVELSKFFIPDENDTELSEFNLIGAYCDKYEHDKYTFLEIGKDNIPHGKVKQFWSYSGMTEKEEQQINEILNG